NRRTRAAESERILAVVRAARDVTHGTQFELELNDSSERVPGILLVPHSDRPVPAALLLHGFASSKEQMTETVGNALLRRGVAALSVDLPMHGTTEPHNILAANPMKLLSAWRTAVKE